MHKWNVIRALNQIQCACDMHCRARKKSVRGPGLPQKIHLTQELLKLTLARHLPAQPTDGLVEKIHRTEELLKLTLGWQFLQQPTDDRVDGDVRFVRVPGLDQGPGR